MLLSKSVKTQVPNSLFLKNKTEIERIKKPEYELLKLEREIENKIER